MCVENTIKPVRLFSNRRIDASEGGWIVVFTNAGDVEFYSITRQIQGNVHILFTWQENVGNAGIMVMVVQDLECFMPSDGISK